MTEGIGYGSSRHDSPANSELLSPKAGTWPEHLSTEQQEEAIARLFRQLVEDNDSRPQEADQIELHVRTGETNEGLGIRLDISV